MATENKTDRRKLVRTEILANGTIVWFRAGENGAEIGRVNPADLPADVQSRARAYGLVQVVADVNSAVDASKRIDAMSATIKTLAGGAWPTRTPAAISPEAAFAALAATMGLSVEQVRAKFGLK